ncbi:MAG TPA: type II secretion system protein GspC [Marinagarivorans sp.]
MTAESLRAAPIVQAATAYLGKFGAVIRKVPTRRWRQLLLVLIALWLCHSVARLFWVVAPVPQQPVASVVPKSSVTQAEAAGAQVDLATLNDLFGKYDPNAERDRLARERAEQLAREASEPVKETKLNLKLQGVIASNEPSKSWAIIGEASSQALYKAGDALPGVRGVKLKSIAELWVILDNNGKAEKLWLYGEDDKKFVATRRTPAPVAPPEDDNVHKAEVDESAVKDIKSIGDVVRFMVATEGGQMIGYKVRPGRKRELFDQVGLKNNDIVVSVNGIEVNEPQKVREVYQALKTATEANLEVMRDGSTQFIQIRMSSG